jgi:hypothetical protein
MSRLGCSAPHSEAVNSGAKTPKSNQWLDKLPPGVFSETQDYTEWLFIRPLFFWIARSLAGVLWQVGFAEVV